MAPRPSREPAKVVTPPPRPRPSCCRLRGGLPLNMDAAPASFPMSVVIESMPPRSPTARERMRLKFTGLYSRSESAICVARLIRFSLGGEMAVGSGRLAAKLWSALLARCDPARLTILMTSPAGFTPPRLFMLRGLRPTNTLGTGLCRTLMARCFRLKGSKTVGNDLSRMCAQSIFANLC